MEFPTADWSLLDAGARAALLERPVQRAAESLYADTRRIVDEVRRDGDRALLAMTERFDGVQLESLEVSEEEFEAAERALPASASRAIDVAIDNVTRFHAAQTSTPLDLETMPGVRCQRIDHPLDAVGLYVPAGSAPLPSTAIMLTVPARIAGCPMRILCTPPRPDGCADPTVLVAARRGGADRVFKVGGAQAIAAMAYGTNTIPAVRKLFGPGNAFVTAAKSIVAADPAGAAIDMAAGPSEVMVIADDTADPGFVAADLLSQAEHGADSQCLLVSDSASLIDAVGRQIDAQAAGHSRLAIVRQAIGNGAAILVPDLNCGVEVSNEYGPEHLILQTADARELLAGIRNAGSVFVGPWSPESVGDYCSGTNHVLPTYGSARAVSGLGVDQFRRHMTIQELTRDGLQALSDTVIELATLEGLDAHADAVRVRLADGQCEAASQ